MRRCHLVSWLFRAGLLLAFAVAVFLSAPAWSPLAERVNRKVLRTFFPATSASEKEAAEPALPPLPDRFFPTARMMTLPLFEGLPVNIQISSTEGQTAAVERVADDSYQLTTRLTYRVPRPARTVQELFGIDESGLSALHSAWPTLPELIQSARVSPYYHSLYERKVTFLGMRLNHVREIPARHNMFDCDTILELTVGGVDPVRALLIQADMDVVTDGSDSDRTLEVDASAPFFQPFTSYNWPKRTAVPNPLADVYRAELDRLTASSDDARRIRVLRQTLEALRYRSSLVAALDPFIVVPIFMTKEVTTHTPAVGDYALVIHNGRIWPAIVGDTGPNSKIGEASLKLARVIQPEMDASGATRPVSDLSVTYVVFCGSADPQMGPPDLAHWEAMGRKWFARIGGNPDAVASWTTQEPSETPLPHPDAAAVPAP